MVSHLIEVEDTNISATLFPISACGVASIDNLYMQGMQGVLRMLFIIKEETKQDMEQ